MATGEKCFIGLPMADVESTIAPSLGERPSAIRFVRHLGAGLALLAVSACDGIQVPNIGLGEPDDGAGAKRGIALAPAPLPRYAAGERFHYSDGRIEQVLALDGNRVFWRRVGGSDFTGGRDFTLPRSAWVWRGKTGSDVLEGAPPSLWPLQVGKATRLSVRRTVTDTDGQSQSSLRDWRCHVADTVLTKVRSGTFEAYEVRCVRYADNNPVEVRIWHYAPEVAHYVRYERRLRRRPPLIRELVAIDPPAEVMSQRVRAQQEEAVQQSLEQQPQGAAIPWGDPRGANGAVTPLTTFRGGDGRYCRSYLITLVVEGARDGQTGMRGYPALACREAGQWLPGYQRDTPAS